MLGKQPPISLINSIRCVQLTHDAGEPRKLFAGLSLATSPSIAEAVDLTGETSQQRHHLLCTPLRLQLAAVMKKERRAQPCCNLRYGSRNFKFKCLQHPNQLKPKFNEHCRHFS